MRVSPRLCETDGDSPSIEAFLKVFRSVPVLMYHQVSPRPHDRFRRFTVTPAEFATQLQWLSWLGYTTVTPDDLWQTRGGGSHLPRRPVLITFDDGLAESLEHAVPLLLARGFSATFYLVAGLMGKSADWLQNEIGTTFPMATWQMARDLIDSGFHCGSHTMTHPRLVRVDPIACREELVRSRAVLEDRLGAPVWHFAYPFGSTNHQVRELANAAGYRTACTTAEAMAEPAGDLLSIPRLPVYGGESMLDFLWRLGSGRARGEWTRELRRRLRKRSSVWRRPWM